MVTVLIFPNDVVMFESTIKFVIKLEYFCATYAQEHGQIIGRVLNNKKFKIFYKYSFQNN